MWKAEKNYCTDSVTESTKATIQEQKLSNKLHMKCSKSQVNNNSSRLQLNWKRLPSMILFSSRENCTPTSTFTAASFTRQWASQRTCSPSCSWSHDVSDGWLTGANSSTTLKTKSSDPDNTTLEMTQEPTFQSMKDQKLTSTSTVSKPPTPKEMLYQTKSKKDNDHL